MGSISVDLGEGNHTADTVAKEFADLYSADKGGISIGGYRFNATKTALAQVIFTQEGTGLTAFTDDGESASTFPNTSTWRIQVGAEQSQTLDISIASMNSKGLNLDKINVFISTRESASAAITSTRNAINKVSTQRAELGALQNRLDHKIANLENTAENLSAAESRIRDVDMAKEMTTFTKQNILAQAATAMLAQANAAPQGVLSLLQ